MKAATVNLNDKVWVRLTAEGRRRLREQHNALVRALPGLKLPEYTPPVEINGWSEWQLWDLMHRLGVFLWNGCQVPFETTIRLEPPT